MKFLLRLAAIFLLVAGGVASTNGHDLPVSDLKVIAKKELMHVEIVLHADELKFFPEIDANRDGIASAGEIASKENQISKVVVDCFTFLVAGKVVSPAVYGMVPNLGSHHLTIRAHYEVDASQLPVKLVSELAAITRRTHVVEVMFQREDIRQQARFDAHTNEAIFDVVKKHEVGKASPELNPRLTDSDAGELLRIKLAVIFGVVSVLAIILRFRA